MWRLAGRLAGLLAVALLLAHGLGLAELPLLRRLDAAWHDLRVRTTAPATPDPRLAIVAIDEAALAAVGQWPWDRARLAELIDRLFERHGVAAIGLDVLLAEPQGGAARSLLQRLIDDPALADPAWQERLRREAERLDGDGRLARALQGRAVVLGHPLTPSDPASGAAPGAAPVGLLPVLAEAARATGFLETLVDPDGVRRRAPLIASVDGQVQRAFALALAQVAQGERGWRLHGAPTVDPWLARLAAGGGEQRQRLGAHADVVLPLRQRAGEARTWSAADVLADRVPDDAMRGRIVLVGITAAGLGDRHATPLRETMPGVQGQAALVGALLDGQVPVQPAWAAAATAAAGLAASAGLAWALRRRGPGLQGLAAAAAIVPWLALNFWAWTALGWALPLAVPATLLAGLAALRLGQAAHAEHQRRRALEAVFGRYVPPELVQRLRESPAELGLQGRSAELTVMFADLHGFTEIAERLPPAELAALMNDFLSDMTDIVRQHGGTLDKYIGDALMAFWGAPLDDPAHADHALAAARAMQAALPALNARFAARGWPALRLGIGINSGTMVVGDLGSRHRRAYTVIGDAVNVAARLQGLTARLREPVLLGEDTARRLIPGTHRSLGVQRLRGRRAPIEVHAPA